MPRAEIICVGSELLAGKVNTHVSYLGPALAEAGFAVLREATVADDRAEVARAVRAACRRAGLVLISGGLGPTFDDITREAVSAALGVGLRYRPRIYAAIRRKFMRYGMSVPVSNKRQAWVLEGARVLKNRRGSAPGQLLTVRMRGRECTIVLMPGPFHELKAMFEASVLPRLPRKTGARARRFTRSFRLYGLAEAAADRLLKPVHSRPGRGIELTILGGLGYADLHASAREASRTRAETALDRLERRIRAAAGKHYVGADGATLESALGERLAAAGWRLATAESCTGGLAGERLTSVPGSSRYYAGGVIAYSNALKCSLLGVLPALLREEGAVSAACARAMALGARERLGVEAALSLTGVAGPAGGTRSKPVGLVYAGLSTARRGRRPARTWSLELRCAGDRRQVRERAVTEALFALLRGLPI